jgi:hypothetical protein
LYHGGHMTELNTAAIVLLAIYFIPAIVAFLRRHRNQNAIAVLNIFLGLVYSWLGRRPGLGLHQS